MRLLWCHLWERIAECSGPRLHYRWLVTLVLPLIAAATVTHDRSFPHQPAVVTTALDAQAGPQSVPQSPLQSADPPLVFPRLASVVRSEMARWPDRGHPHTNGPLRHADVLMRNGRFESTARLTKNIIENNVPGGRHDADAMLAARLLQVKALLMSEAPTRASGPLHGLLQMLETSPHTAPRQPVLCEVLLLAALRDNQWTLAQAHIERCDQHADAMEPLIAYAERYLLLAVTTALQRQDSEATVEYWALLERLSLSSLAAGSSVPSTQRPPPGRRTISVQHEATTWQHSHNQLVRALAVYYATRAGRVLQSQRRLPPVYMAFERLSAGLGYNHWLVKLYEPMVTEVLMQQALESA